MNQPTGTTIIHTFLKSLFLQHLHEEVNTVLSLQPSLLVSLQDDILRHLYRGISTFVSLQLSLLTSLRSRFLQASIFMSLGNLCPQHLYGGISTILPIQAKHVIFLRRLYKCISTAFPIQAKSVIFLQRLYKYIYTVFFTPIKPETPTFKLLLNVSLHASVIHFYKYIGYNVNDWIINFVIDSNNTLLIE